MAHVQQQILDAIQQVVIAADTVAGTNVFVDLLDPLPKGTRFACLVRESDNGETIQVASIQDRQERRFEVEIANVVRLGEFEGGRGATPASTARDFGLAVEKALAPRSAALNALCKSWTIVSSRPVQSGEGDEAVAACVQTWHFTYYVRKTAPDVPL